MISSYNASTDSTILSIPNDLVIRGAPLKQSLRDELHRQREQDPIRRAAESAGGVR